MNGETEYALVCPYCWQEITMLLDTSVAHQVYVEDCENCCNPIEVEYRTDEDGLISEFDARMLE
mgnify:CR=1 FL=1